MTGAMIAQLIVALGPVALTLIPKLVAIWSTPLTQAQVDDFCDLALKDYDTYIAEAKAKLANS
mgnify:CR=1 FL=1